VGVIACVALIAMMAASVKATDEDLQIAIDNENEDGTEFTLDETPVAASTSEDKEKAKPKPVPKSTQGIVAHAEAVRRAKQKAAASQTRAERLARKIARRAALRRRLKQLRDQKNRKRMDPELRNMMDDVVRRMASAAQVTFPTGPFGVNKETGQMRSLEKKLAYFEEQYRDNSQKRNKAEMKAINDRINKIHDAVKQLKKNAKAQSIVTQKLLQEEARRDPLNTVIGDGPKYQPARGLPKGWEKQVQRVINSVKRDAGKIYRANCGKNRPFCKVVRKINKAEEPKAAPKAAKKPAAAPKPVAKTEQSYVDNAADK